MPFRTLQLHFKDILYTWSTWLRRGCRFFDAIRPERFFLVVATITVLCVVLILPPFQGPDERTHFLRATQLSYGEIRAHKYSDREVGSHLPSEYDATIAHYRYLWGHVDEKVDISAVVEDATNDQHYTNSTVTVFENTAMYPPISYIPQAITIAAARAVHLPVVVQMYLARMAVGVCWVLLVFFAIRWLPFGKWAAVAFALLPWAIILASSVSGDAITFGLGLLLIAKVLETRKQRVLSYRSMVQILALSLLLGLAKPPYQILVLTVLMLPRKLFLHRRVYVRYLLVCIGGAGLLALGWMLLVRGLYIPTNPVADTSAQLGHILHNPVSSLITMTSSLFWGPTSDFVVMDIAGLQTWLAIHIPNTIVIANLLVVIAMLLVRSPQDSSEMIPAKHRRLLVVLSLVGAYLVSLQIYLSFDAPASQSVDGLNSRYFMPFWYLLIPAFNHVIIQPARSAERLFRISKLAMIAVCVIVIGAIVSRFYA
jgi:uncharacterized membrane protein